MGGGNAERLVVGIVVAGRRGRAPARGSARRQAQVLQDPPRLLVTLEKSERDYSPSTLYKDYAISPELFHWESQVSTSQRSTSGQRYIHHRGRGGHILLFVRERREQDGRTMPYTFLGPADYVSHKADRPIAFVWRLRRPMPAALFRDAKVAAG